MLIKTNEGIFVEGKWGEMKEELNVLNDCECSV